MAKAPNAPCPCGSGSKYKRCCRPLHQGTAPATPEALMRSRYAAYALGEVEFILETTHPDGPPWRPDRAAWAAEVAEFCRDTAFEGLEVLETGQADEDEGWVTFHASLTQRGRDVSFTERSRFLRHEGRWRYHSGREPEGAGR